MAYRWASWVGVMWLPLAALLALGGCDKIPGMGGKDDSADDDDNDDNDDNDDGKKAKKKKKGGGDDDATKTASVGGGSTGVAECDSYLAKYLECYPSQSANAAAMGANYKRAAANSASRSAIVASCTQAMTTIKNCKPGANLPPTTAGGDGPSSITGTAPPPVAVTPGKEASPFINSRSAVPTIPEWDAQTKEVTVRGSTKLNCETKMVREWLRVSCRGKSQHGGEPTGVTVTKGGGRGDDFTFASNKVASLVVRFVPGVDLDARFTWTDRSANLRVWWPRGAPEPPYKGTFK
jgi:hypothetical protein